MFTTAPRDFCLIRYWRDNFDGSYVICLDTTTHPECPLVDGYVRGDLHAAYIVAPPKGKLTGAAYGAAAKVCTSAFLNFNQSFSFGIRYWKCPIDPLNLALKTSVVYLFSCTCLISSQKNITSKYYNVHLYD